MTIALGIVALCMFAAGCVRDSDAAPTTAPTPAVEPSAANVRGRSSEVDRLLQRATAAAGGLDRWRQLQDGGFISTLTLFDQQGSATSETIFYHKLQWRQGMQARLESIGLLEEVIFGFDGSRDWMLRGGLGVSDVANTAFTRFHALSSTFWFGLPFVLVDAPGELTYLGEENRGDQIWEKLRIDRTAAEPLPAQWAILYFDKQTARLDRVQVEVTVEFLAHRLWLGRWRDYREIEGIQRERRRLFYPCDEQGEVIGSLAAEQLIEHVRFHNDWPAKLFERPLIAGGGAPAG